MMDAKRIESPLLKDLGLTSLFCFIVAMMTFSIWPGSIVVHLLISFGFGYSAIFTSKLVRVLLPKLSSNSTILISLTGSIVLGSIHAYAWIGVYHNVSSPNYMVSVVLMGVVFSSICFAYFYTQDKKMVAEQALEKAKRKQAESDKALILSQLNQLQSQIEPHFLFNTLANISVLIDQDTVLAKQTLHHLTDLLRATLRSNRTRLTSIDDELAIMSAYLDIQKIRLSDRLSFNIDCEQELRMLMIPPFLIQPLIENAITHGIETLTEGGVIDLNILKSSENIIISIIDNGRGFNLAENHGQGLALKNIRDRLKTLYSDTANLTVKENQNGGVTSTLVLPIDALSMGKGDYS